jgi:RHS repeat-associated protein
VLFDDQFKMVTSGSGADPVGADQEFKTHVKNNLPITKNGYLYVFVSNETPNINVYFDNLQVTHIKGPLLQEQSYYPFGLEMAGISDQAVGKLDSKNKFNGGVEFEEDYGVNLYSTFYRKYDPQIGRFSGVDCQSEASIGMSVYQFAGNNPVMLNDPLGNKMTAGLWDRGNGYYDFQGEHHQQQSADPLAGTFMDADYYGGSGGAGGNGGGGGSRGKSSGSVDYTQAVL